MRIEQITFTRFIAALLIVVFHYGATIFPFNLLEKAFLGANLGVSYFFILSGFVMIIAYHKNKKISSTNYLKNRFARIYPVYLLATLLLVFYYIFTTNVSIDFKEFILNIFMIQSWIPGYALTLNFPGWSLSVELFFYISFPFLLNHIYRKYSFNTLSFLIVLFFIISQVLFLIISNSNLNHGLHSTSHDLIFYFPLSHINQFLIGNLLGLYFVNKETIKKKDNSFKIILIIVILFFILTFSSSVHYHNGLLAFIFVPLILLIASDNSFISKFSNKKMPIHLGEISYGIYILQIPVFSMSRRVLISLGINNKTIIFYTSLLILIVFSSLTYKYFESPLRKRIKKFKFVRIKP